MKTKEAKVLADNIEKYMVNGRYSSKRSDEIRLYRKEQALKHVQEGKATNFEKSMVQRTTVGTWTKRYERMVTKVFNIGMLAATHYSTTERLLINALKQR